MKSEKITIKHDGEPIITVRHIELAEILIKRARKILEIVENSQEMKVYTKAAEKLKEAAKCSPGPTRLGLLEEFFNWINDEGEYLIEYGWITLTGSDTWPEDQAYLAFATAGIVWVG